MEAYSSTSNVTDYLGLQALPWNKTESEYRFASNESINGISYFVQSYFKNGTNNIEWALYEAAGLALRFGPTGMQNRDNF